MSWVLVFLGLLVHCTGCSPQPVLSQPPSMASFLGDTVRLACTVRGDHDIGLHSIYWYQQKPGHPPRFLLRYFSHSDKRLGPNVPPRFSGSKDLAKNTGYLSIAGLQAEDEAVYICAVGALGIGRRRERQREEREERELATPGSQGPGAPRDTLPLH